MALDLPSLGAGDASEGEWGGEGREGDKPERGGGAGTGTATAEEMRGRRRGSRDRGHGDGGSRLSSSSCKLLPHKSMRRYHSFFSFRPLLRPYLLKQRDGGRGRGGMDMLGIFYREGRTSASIWRHAAAIDWQRKLELVGPSTNSKRQKFKSTPSPISNPRHNFWWAHLQWL